MKTIKKAWSILLAITLIFTTLFSNYFVEAATVHTLDNTNKTEKEFTVHMKLPLPGSPGAIICGCDRPNLYSYYRVDENTTQPLSKAWPGDLMRMEKSVDDGTWWKFTYKAPSDSIRIMFLTGISELEKLDDDGNIIGIDYVVRNSYPKDKGEYSREDNGFLISGEVWFDPLTMDEPVYQNPDITPTPIPTNTPIVATTPAIKPTDTPKVSTPEPTPVVTPVATDEPVTMPSTEPVSGPQAIVDCPSGTTYYQENTDYLDITVTPAYGATSTEVSVDDGPVATITEATKFKVGTGKIANSIITMTVTSTDGATTNTQHFYYYKRTSVETPSQATSRIQVSSAMVTLFQTVKAAANEQKDTYTVTFKVPDESKETTKIWSNPDYQIYAYAYHNSATGEINPLGKWPGQKMTLVSGTTDTYTIEVPSSTGEVTVLFACMNGEKTLAQYPSHDDPGYTIKSDANFDANSLPTASPEPSPEITETPTEVVSTTPPVSETPDVSAPATTAPVETEPANTPSTSPEVKQLTGYFGASLAGPQYNTTKLDITAVAKQVQGTATYTFAVNGKIVANNVSDPVYTWDASTFKAGNYTLTVMITDSATNKSITLDKIYPLTEKTEAGDITPEPFTPSPTPTELPTEIPTEVPTEVPTVTPTEVVTSTPNVAVTTLPAITTSTPVVTETVTATAIVTAPATTTSPIPTDVPAAPVTQAPIVGNIAFSKGSNKITIGDTVQINYSQKNESVDQNYTFTYRIKLGSTTTTLKSNTSKKSISWTPKRSGTYTISVLAYDQAKKLVCTTKVTYKVKKTVITLKSFQPKTIKRGKKVTISLRATSSSGTLQYKVIIKNKKGKTVKAKAYSKKRTFTWRPSKKGTYTATIYLKNGKGASIIVKRTIKVK